MPDCLPTLFITLRSSGKAIPICLMKLTKWELGDMLLKKRSNLKIQIRETGGNLGWNPLTMRLCNFSVSIKEIMRETLAALSTNARFSESSSFELVLRFFMASLAMGVPLSLRKSIIAPTDLVMLNIFVAVSAIFEPSWGVPKKKMTLVFSSTNLYRSGRSFARTKA